VSRTPTTFQNWANFPVDRGSGRQLSEALVAYPIVLTMMATTASALTMMKLDWNIPEESRAFARRPLPAHFRQLAAPCKPFVAQVLSGRQPGPIPTHSG
jgi:hypothetical protein